MEIAALVGAAGSALGGGGFFVARATVRAAQATARANEAVARLTTEPERRTVDLAILRETAERVDRENAEIRTELTGLRALVRAYSWTVDRLIRHMEVARVPADPDDVHELVREHMRTGA